jgi:hypothetical protein
MRRVVHDTHAGMVTDQWGHPLGHHHHRHSHLIPEHWFPRWAEQSAEVTADAEAAEGATFRVETEHAMAEGVHMEADAEAGAEVEAEVVAESEAETEAESESEAESEAEAESEYVNVAVGRHTTSVSAAATNIRQIAPRVVRSPRVRPVNAADMSRMASNGAVPSAHDQDPLADHNFDCNFYDCTGTSSEPFVPVGSLNPDIPYRNPGEARTTTFSTVPDMLEPRSEVKMVIVD